MFLVLNYKPVLFGNYLIKRFDILFGFINRFKAVSFGLVARRSQERRRRVLQFGIRAGFRPGSDPGRRFMGLRFQ